MSTTVFLMAALGLAALVATLAAVVLLRRRSRAGMSTSMTVRTAQVGSLVTRSALRKMRLRVRQLLAQRERRKQLEHEYHVKTAEEAAALMGNMKGVFMKLGQILSFASESLPPQAQTMLRQLQQNAPPMDFALARQVLEVELGADIGTLFQSFDETPLAAASIGQVHRARLRDGTQVAVKVQYPDVDKAIEADLRLSSGLASMISAVHKNADANAIVAELKARLLDEVDYRKELHNQHLFYTRWQGHPYIHIPRVFPALSSKKVLCQEYRRGLSFYDFLGVSTAKERQLAAFVLNDFVFDSMHLHHVMNGDPHPGNYLFQEDGGVTFLDFGCIKYFTASFIADLQSLNRAIVSRDRDRFDEYIRKLQIVLPGRPYDRDAVWEFFSYHAAPFAEDREFVFTEDYIKAAAEIFRFETVQKLNLPPDFLFFNRITFGLNSIFCKLGARANWNRYYHRYMYPERQVPPALASLGIELPERFLTTQIEPYRPGEMPAK